MVQHLFMGDGDVARWLEPGLNPVVEAQAADALQAAPYERTPECQRPRHGSYPQDLTPRVGPIPLQVPRVRDGAFSPERCARYRSTEQARVLAWLEMGATGAPPGKSRASPQNSAASTSRRRRWRPTASTWTWWPRGGRPQALTATV